VIRGEEFKAREGVLRLQLTSVNGSWFHSVCQTTSVLYFLGSNRCRHGLLNFESSLKDQFSLLLACIV